MPNYKVVDTGRLDAAMTATADAIREKTSGTDPIPWNAETGFAEAVAGITGSGTAVPVLMKDVNFYDYDGTRLYSYTVEEAAALTELPPLPTQPGLICQGWNWTLDGIKAMGRAVDVGAMYITDDGETRIYITLNEGRTSPSLACCPNGTVTVDWGDGTEPNFLTGTDTSKSGWKQTPRHNYAAPGDYVITLTVDGQMALYGDSATYSAVLCHAVNYDDRNLNRAYLRSVRKIELGNGITSINAYTFHSCYGLKTITVPYGVTTFDTYAFYNCDELSEIVIPNSVTNINTYAFSGCTSVSGIIIPESITKLEQAIFYSMRGLGNIVIPDSITSIASNAFRYCYNITNIIIPGSVASIGATTFDGCYGVRYYDFTRHTAVPELSNVNAFNTIAADCEIRVPAALADAWKAATNWATYADYIVGV